jgi:predicted Zn-dependent peptidase
VLDNVLSTRLRDRLREALGATYSPVSAIAADEAPDALIETFIQVSGDPARLDEIVSEVEAVLDDLRSGSLSTAELNTAREQVRRDFELVSNSFWIEQMLYAATHPGVTMLTGIERINTAASVSLERLNTLIGEIWPADQYIVVTLGPET